MRVGIGYSDNPDTRVGGVRAVQMALEKSGRDEPCDMMLLCSTARHDAQILREAVASVVGSSVPIYGGGAVGVITNEYFGYAGDQIAALCMWLDGVACDVVAEGGLLESEQDAGARIGRRLAELGTEPDSPVLLFYDAIDNSEQGVRLLMATWLLEGMEQALGFLPDLVGAGMQGDHSCSPAGQWLGDVTASHHAMALKFSGDLRMDSVIVHGCRPATGYYTVTKAEGPMILEINGTPALRFLDELLGSGATPEEYPFSLIFGINHGERWGEYDENYYASRLCLGIDREREAIIMFEPDMVEGTQFQLMYRSLDLGYMRPKIEKAFEDMGDRKPVFALYIDCAGRCAGYGGMDIEDACVIQETVGDRVPLFGIYTGVEIASIGGRPRGLDWTGVFCLFSQSGNSEEAPRLSEVKPVWESSELREESNEVSLEALGRICELNAAKIFSLDSGSIAIRHELEQKRRGFSLLAELAVSLRHGASYESVFIPVARRLNAALNMQKTVVLVPKGDGFLSAAVLQGYSPRERALLADKRIMAVPEMLDPDHPILVTGADPASRLAELRELLGLPYFVSAPVILQDKVAAILITGRMVEAHPYLLRLGRGDVETVQAISALLASFLAGQALAASEERNHIMVDAMPLCCVFWDEYGNQTDCNREALSLFGLSSKEDFLARLYSMFPERQPDGSPSGETIRELVLRAFVTGGACFEWTFMTLSGELIPAEVKLVRVPRGEDYIMAGYIRDLREQQAAIESLKEAKELAERNDRAKSEFLASVSHEIRTPLNAVLAMAQSLSDDDAPERRQRMIDQGTRSAKLLTAAIESILDFSKIDSGTLSLETVEFSPAALVESICSLMREEADEKGVGLITKVESDVPAVLIGDSVRLEQILFNLAANAVKFTDRGYVSISVTAERETPSGKVPVRFSVRDSGSGIEPEMMTKLFSPFTLGDSSYTRKQGGLGMGLAVAASLASLMGGKITCESSVGEGSVFDLIIPFSRPGEREENGGDEVSAARADGLEGLRVLVAEDNIINQMIAEEILNSAGIVTTIVNNGLEAVAAIKEGAFDIVLMDIQMPEMNGLTATAQIRSDERFSKLPILAMTANSGVGHQDESFKVGMNGHLTKPIDIEELFSALRHWGGVKVKEEVQSSRKELMQMMIAKPLPNIEDGVRVQADFEAMVRLFGAFRTSVQDERQGLFLCDGGTETPLENYALLLPGRVPDSPLAVRELVRQGLDFFSARRRSHIWALFPGVPAAAELELDCAGIPAGDDFYGMVAESGAMDGVELREGMSTVYFGPDDDPYAWAEATWLGFDSEEAPPESFVKFTAEAMACPKLTLLGVTARDSEGRERLAATGMLCDSPDRAGIYYVATHPDFRRRGMATGVMKALMDRAKQQGKSRACLLATPDGRPLYHRCGFRDASIVRIRVADYAAQ